MFFFSFTIHNTQDVNSLHFTIKLVLLEAANTTADSKRTLVCVFNYCSVTCGVFGVFLLLLAEFGELAKRGR